MSDHSPSPASRAPGAMAPAPIRLDFPGLPARLIPYARALFSRKPSLAPADQVLQQIEVRGRNVRVARRALRRYLEVCGTTGKDLAVPPLYPQVLAMPLHLRLLTAPAFPVRPLGIVHLRNIVRQTESVPVETRFELETALIARREMDAGQEYDIVTRIRLDGHVPWEARTTFLVRRPASEVKARPTRIAAARRSGSEDDALVALPAAENIGRRYALVSGDYNPIHLNARTAGWFGFRKAIAHGMWSLAATLVAAKRDVYTQPLEIDARFNAPIYLPANLAVARIPEPDSKRVRERYLLRDAQKPRVHLEVDIAWI